MSSVGNIRSSNIRAQRIANNQDLSKIRSQKLSIRQQKNMITSERSRIQRAKSNITTQEIKLRRQDVTLSGKAQQLSKQEKALRKPLPSEIVSTQKNVISKNTFQPITDPNDAAKQVGFFINAHV